jgi:hypothetical protein
MTFPSKRAQIAALLFIVLVASLGYFRGWFGNTRVVSATQLDRFREVMASKAADPYAVVLHSKALPMGLLVDNKALMHVVGTRMDYVTDRLRCVPRAQVAPRVGRPTPCAPLPPSLGGRGGRAAALWRPAAPARGARRCERASACQIGEWTFPQPADWFPGGPRSRLAAPQG